MEKKLNKMEADGRGGGVGHGPRGHRGSVTMYVYVYYINKHPPPLSQCTCAFAR